ncbi:MAG: hypothetical protein QOG72_778 [Sphingomonadales bacterium]|jgi:hypothetical protein|nr:hypothetical protein [Sphingomonadales bacterium]
MIALALALAAAAGAAPRLVYCHMMECSWSKPVSNVAIRTARGDVLRRIVAIQGVSVHRDDYPSRYSSSVPIRWEKAPNVDYVLCSRRQPALAFSSDGRWTAHALDLFNLAGYNTASAVIYLRACHGIDLSRGDIETVLRRLGYRAGTRSDQVEISRPEQLFDLPARRRD